MRSSHPYGVTPDASWLCLIRECFRYDAATGAIFWAATRKRSNMVAGAKNGQGYIRLTLKRRYFSAHRVAWFLHYGEWPSTCVDHINGDRCDNRIANLRLTTMAENIWNKPLAQKRGTYFCNQTRGAKKWRSAIEVNGKRIRLGYFATQEEAAAAYEEARREHHGPFIRAS